MFKINAQIKKLIQSGNTCAYIYKDGIAINEERRIQSGKHTTRLNVMHYYPCEIKLYSHNYDPLQESDITCNRIVVHSPTMLLSGLEKVEVHYHNRSEKMKETGGDCTTVEFIAPNGQTFRQHNSTGFYNCDITVQPDPLNQYYKNGSTPSTIVECIEYSKDHYEAFEIHDQPKEVN